MTHTLSNARLEAFCDGVFAIAITLLIIEIRIPETEPIDDTAALWLALRHTVPQILSFLLSFAVIFITWVNHHAVLKLVVGSSPAFLFANGFLLLTVAAVPFPTALLGAYVVTGQAGPAVSIYNSVLALQAVGWFLLTHAVLAGRLARNDAAVAIVQMSRRYSLGALALYVLCAVIALGFPRSIAIVTVLVWSFWLVLAVINQTPADASA